jgi:hypothetical protein
VPDKKAVASKANLPLPPVVSLKPSQDSPAGTDIETGKSTIEAIWPGPGGPPATNDESRMEPICVAPVKEAPPAGVPATPALPPEFGTKNTSTVPPSDGVIASIRSLISVTVVTTGESNDTASGPFEGTPAELSCPAAV